jgi:hypothetical protein
MSSFQFSHASSTSTLASGAGTLFVGCFTITPEELHGGATFIGEPSVATGTRTKSLNAVASLLPRREFLAALLAISFDH